MMEIGEKLKKRFFNIKNACYSGYPASWFSDVLISVNVVL